MQKLTFLAAVSLLSFGGMTAFKGSTEPSFNSSETVYICTGPQSKKYHLNKNCTGLRNCSAEVKAVTKDQAVQMGRGLCGYED